jgi:hypothetical protein
MNKNHVLMENAFENLKNLRKIIKNVNACVDKTPMITCACCPLHFFLFFVFWGQLQGMMKLVVCDV